MNKRSIKKNLIASFLKLFGMKEEILQLHKALGGITATFKAGDRVALIGKNGSGKSTLLRVLSGIYQPTAGSLEIHGTISSLLDIGVGLHPDATGYENIILMGVLHGKTRSEMRGKFEEIETFTELKDFLKLPVSTYSSGMRLRLAFGIATCMESDILMIDEVIGVGDHTFIEKAQTRMKHLMNKSQILVLASHATSILKQFCNKAMVLDKGKCTFFGELEQGIQFYEANR
jgi:ABC-type polysaccharide/polyol phosphate transport system ATPase subunit